MRFPLLALSFLSVVACPVEGARLEKGVDTGNGLTDRDGDGFTTEEGDCDDTNDQVSPTALELCDNVDNDCDGELDEGLGSLWYPDVDGDGFGDLTLGLASCEPPNATYIADGTDCDDARPDVYPGAEELCYNADNDCDSLVDEEGTTAYYADADADGHGDPDTGFVTCKDVGAGYVIDNTDCDDTTDSVYPGHAEECDALDNDCDGSVDEGVTTTYYVDLDEDEYGDDGLAIEACSTPTGYAQAGGDCDDADPAFNPGAAESCDEDVDYNCDGSVAYADADGDGWAACQDCDDTAAEVNPATWTPPPGRCGTPTRTATATATPLRRPGPVSPPPGPLRTTRIATTRTAP